MAVAALLLAGLVPVHAQEAGETGAPAAAEAAPELDAVSKAVSALASGDPAPALTLLESRAAAEILSDTQRLHVLADRAWRYEPRCLDAPAQTRRDLAERLILRTTTAAGKAPDDAHATWALALALVLGERAGVGTGPDAWERAADLLVELPADAAQRRQALGYAITFLIEGGVAEKGHRRGLFGRADKLARSPEAVGMEASCAEVNLWAAGVLLDGQRSYAKDRTKATLDLLRDAAHGEPPDEEAATLWNDTVVFADDEGFALKERFVTRPELVLDGALVLEVPRSSRFLVTDGSRAADRYVTELDGEGMPVRQLLFRRYEFGTDHAFVGPNRVGGDNAKKIAEGLRDLATLQILGGDADTSKIKRADLTRDLDGWSFSIAGTTRELEPRALRVEGWCGRGQRQATYGVLLYLYGEETEIGTAMQSVLDSITEVTD